MGIKVNGNEPACLARTAAASILGIAAACIVLPSDALAQAWPAKPVRFILGFPPGGGSDILGRIVAAKMQEQMGQTVVIENRPGASGNIAAEQVAKSAPDGYTIYLAQIAAVAISPSLFPKLGYDPLRDFAPISLIATGPNVLVVHPSLPVKNVKDLIALARQQPGQMNYASVGPGSIQHLAGESFNLLAGVKTVHVPYKGSSPAGLDLMAGQVAFMFDSTPPITAFIKSGRMRALAVTSLQPTALAPGLPLWSDSLPGYEAVSLNGMLAPARTPENIIRQINAEVAKVMTRADIKEKLVAAGTDAMSTSPEEFSAIIQADMAKWGKFIREAGIRE